MNDVRNNKVILLFGERGAGKTFYARNFLLQYRQAHPEQKALILDTFRSPKYLDLAAIKIEDIARWRNANTYVCWNSDTDKINAAVQQLYNALIIYEDASKFFDSNQLPPDLKKYVIDTKQKNVDILMLFHGYTFCPPKLFRLADEIIVMKTKDSPKNRKNDIPNYDYLMHCYQAIMDHPDPHARIHVKI